MGECVPEAAAAGGFIWYQGESDVGAPGLYGESWVALVRSWRSAWEAAELPFICIQLPNIDRKPEPSLSGWPELRQGRLRLLAVRETALVVTIDVGDPADIHPTHKQPVAERAMRAAKVLAYGAEAAPGLSPLPESWAEENGGLRVKFAHVTGALATRDGESAGGFVAAGADRVSLPAKVRLDGDEAVISTASASGVRAVRYARADNPAANLIDGAGLLRGYLAERPLLPDALRGFFRVIASGGTGPVVAPGTKVAARVMSW